jgi:hypothetical protein
MTTRLQINTAHIDKHTVQVCITIKNRRSRKVQWRTAIARKDITHNDAVTNQHQDGSRALGCERTQVVASDRVERRAGLEQHQRTAPTVIHTVTYRIA